MQIDKSFRMKVGYRRECQRDNRQAKNLPMARAGKIWTKSNIAWQIKVWEK